MAEITKLYVERLKALEKFENVRVGVEVQLEPGDDPKSVYEELRLYVHDLAEMDENSIRLARQQAEIRSGKKV